MRARHAQYYGAFAVLYGLAGSCAQVVMTNSTWTSDHIRRLWRLNAPGAIFVVFPPCDVASLKELPEGPRERVALSIGQFRPEKDHALQVGSRAMRRTPLAFRRTPGALFAGRARSYAPSTSCAKWATSSVTVGSSWPAAAGGRGATLASRRSE